MKAPLSAGHLAITLLALSPAVSALAWPRWLPELDTLVVRQDESESVTPTPTPTPSPSSDDNQDTPSSSDNGDSGPTSTKHNPFQPITTNLNTGGITRSGATPTGTGSRAHDNSTHTTARPTFDAQDPPGSVVMVTPAPTDGTQLYKIGEFVTWGWNYTNLLATPTAIDVVIKCSKVPQPWTLTSNMSFSEVGSYTWDTGAYQSSHVATPLLTEQYTLVIADADGGISATPEPGYLAPFSGFTFGLYEKQPYSDTGEGWQCASCSGAVSGLDGRAVGVAMLTSVLTVLSFTWFVAGFGDFL
ncbi:hypothetical protein VTK56DRAFT_10285 [Thermocarpiscus australiensis]